MIKSSQATQASQNSMFNAFDTLSLVNTVSSKSNKSKSYGILKAFTGGLTLPKDNPSRRIIMTMDHLNNTLGGLMRYIRGYCLELSIIESIIYFSSGDKTIKIDSCECGREAHKNHALWEKYKPDVDFLINKKVAIQSKYSVRERHFLADRTFMVPHMENYDKYFIFFKDYPYHTTAQAIDHAKRLKDVFVSDTNVITIHDEERMFNMYNEWAA